MSKYLLIDIAKTLGTELYVQVPDDFDLSNARSLPLEKFAREQVDDSFSWQEEPGIEFCGARFVEEKEAKQFTMSNAQSEPVAHEK